MRSRRSSSSARRSSSGATPSSSRRRRTSARSWRSAASRRRSSRCRSTRHGLDVDELERRLAEGLRPKLVYSIPDHQNPAGVTLSAERRARSSSSRADTASDRRGRRVPRARLRRRRRAAEPVEPRARRRRAGRHDVEDVLPRRCGSAGRSRRRRSRSDSSRRSRSPTSAPARSASVSSRNTSAAAGSTSSSRSHARSTGASARVARRARAPHARRRAVDDPTGGFFSWLTLPDGVDSTTLAARAAEHGVGIVPGTLFFADGRGDGQRAPLLQHGRRVADRRRRRAARVADPLVDHEADRDGADAPVAEAEVGDGASRQERADEAVLEAGLVLAGDVARLSF